MPHDLCVESASQRIFFGVGTPKDSGLGSARNEYNNVHQKSQQQDLNGDINNTLLTYVV